MNSINNNKLTQSPKWMKYFNFYKIVALTFVFTFATVSCHDDMIAPSIPDELDDPIIEEPSSIVIGGAGSEAIGVIFESLGEATSLAFAEEGVGWIMGALGLAGEGPDYTEQLDLIAEELQEIIEELAAIEEELQEINQELLVLDCDEQQTAMTLEIGRIDFLLSKYQNFVSVANLGLQNSSADLQNWVDQVLAEGAFTSQEPIGQILATMAAKLLSPNSGAITACVRSIKHPEDKSFDDTPYYDQVSHFTTYYYYYQTQALMLYVEALHYKAWVAAGSPVDINADEITQVCSDPSGGVYCVEAANAVNRLYNNLVNQFTAGGAPYTDSLFLMENHSSSPSLWVRSLEDFTAAAGDNCTSPLQSTNGSHPCGIAAGVYNEDIRHVVNYGGYKTFTFANTTRLKSLLNGWTSGKAGGFLRDKRGFKNMSDKIIIASDAKSIKLNNWNKKHDLVPFFDGSMHYGYSDGFIRNKSNFNNIAHSEVVSTHCGTYGSFYYDFSPEDGYPSDRNSFYKLDMDTGPGCTEADNWHKTPGWKASKNFKQYRWPIGHGGLFTNHATHNRSTKNVGGKWTMCGDNFTVWLEEIVPRPPSCDNSSLIPCNL